MVTDCKFCSLSEDPEAVIIGSVYVVADAYPVTTGHSLIIPLCHRSDYFDLSREELADTHRALERLRRELWTTGAEAFNIGWNCGQAAGQTVEHAHCHLIPRRAGDSKDASGGVRGVIPERQKYVPTGQAERILLSTT